MPNRIRWPFSGKDHGKEWKARRTLSGIIVQVFDPKNPARVAEWKMPRVLDVQAAAAQAVLQTGEYDYA